MSDTDTVKLKPCPFCGSDNVQDGGDDKVVGVWCHSCGATGPNGYLTINGDFDWNTRTVAALPPAVPALSVRYLSMPESNGRENWTAILYADGKDDMTDGYCFARSEYPDRVRYDADRMRYLIGETDKRPYILDYDADKCSDYVPPTTPDPVSEAAKVLLRPDDKGSRKPIHDACENRVKVYKFDAVLRALTKDGD